MSKVVINEKECIGCGTCSFLAPKIFKLGKKGKAEVISQPKDGDGKLKEAMGSCPVNAISLEK